MISVPRKNSTEMPAAQRAIIVCSIIPIRIRISSTMPPIAIPNHAMNAVLRGFVDRVDVWDSGVSRYFRVVDYKTGKKDFDYCDVYNGVGL